MKFVYPEFLYALSAIAIPILIHLFNFRRYKKVYFSNVKFLREIQEQTKSRSQLKHLLILLLRILAISALVLAFAQPYWPAKNKQKEAQERIVSVYIDNSFSMEADGKNGKLLDEAKRTAIRIANDFGATDKFQLLTNDFHAFHQRVVNKAEFIDMVEEVDVSPVARTLSAIYLRQNDIIQGRAETAFSPFMLSDFQESIVDFNKIELDTSYSTSLMCFKAQQKSNVYIDSIWFEKPVRKLNSQEKLHVKIINDSQEKVSGVKVNLSINGVAKAIDNIAIEANNYNISVLNYTITESGVQRGRVYIEDLQINFDDDFYFGYEIVDQTPILVINGDGNESSRFFKALYAQDTDFEFSETSENNIDPSNLSQQNLIIINGLDVIPSGISELLKNVVQDGSSLMIFPSSDIDFPSYSSFLSSMNVGGYSKKDTSAIRVTDVDLEHDIFSNMFEDIPDNLDLPKVNSRYKMRQFTKSNEEVLMKYQNNESFFSKYSFGKGKVYLFSVALDESWTNFPKHAFFATTLLRVAEFSLPSTKLYHEIGKSVAIELKNENYSGESIFHITNNELKFDLIPEVVYSRNKVELIINRELSNLDNRHQVFKAENYDLLFNEKLIGATGFNYDRKESVMKCLTDKEINKKLEYEGVNSFRLLDMKHSDRPMNFAKLDKRTKLWKLFILLTLIFLGAEVVLLRLWKS